MAHWKSLKGGRSWMGATEAKAGAKAARHVADAAAIAEGLAELEPSQVEVDHEWAAIMDAELAEILAAESKYEDWVFPA